MKKKTKKSVKKLIDDLCKAVTLSRGEKFVPNFDLDLEDAIIAVVYKFFSNSKIKELL